MARTLTDARRWAAQGTTGFLDAVDRLTEDQYEAPSLLPGWTRKHLVAHVAANADALGNLVQWATTGVRTPMYASLEERDAGIARGAVLTGTELTSWCRRAAATLEESMSQLTEAQWLAQVVTAQGRTVAATEIPWMRSREILVHAVDLGTGVEFADLPADYLEALVVDVCTKRDIDAAALPGGPLPDVAAWLAGRPHHLTTAPDLGPWL